MQTKIFNDNWTLRDLIGHKKHVLNIAEMIAQCDPPYVLGIHGDWGAGKTSFLRKLHLYLAGKSCGYKDADDFCQQLWDKDITKHPNIATIWFDAWRYQFEENPVVALLNEIRAHFTLSKNLVRETGKLSYAALMSIEDITKKIGIAPGKIVSGGEKWERDHMSQPLPSQLCKELLEQAIATLLGRNKGRKRLVIFVDDLDRCTGSVAFRFLEAMKIYLSLSNCVFVLGMDVRHIRRAVAAELKSAGVIPEPNVENQPDKAELYAADYLSKMFQHVFYLPYVANYKKYLDFLTSGSGLTELDEWVKIIGDYNLLPPNPRKIKSFISGFIFYVNQLSEQLEKWNNEKDGDEKLSIDKELALIFAYLKLMANDIYRILEAEPEFWNRLVDFCKNGQHNGHWALNKLTHPEKASPSGEAEYEYESAFPDPSDEGLFRAARLIREYRQGSRPTKDEFESYLLQV